jgi:hypothetical protein
MLQVAGCKLQVAGRESYGGQRAWNELQLKSGAACQLSAVSFQPDTIISIQKPFRRGGSKIRNQKIRNHKSIHIPS